MSDPRKRSQNALRSGFSTVNRVRINPCVVLVRLLVVGMSAALLMGCASTPSTDSGYGARNRKVKLVATPARLPECQVYLIPNEVWLAHRSTLSEPNSPLLEKYHRGASGTEVHILPYTWILASRGSDGNLRFMSFVPREDGSVTLDMDNGTVLRTPSTSSATTRAN